MQGKKVVASSAVILEMQAAWTLGIQWRVLQIFYGQWRKMQPLYTVTVLSSGHCHMYIKIHTHNLHVHMCPYTHNTQPVHTDTHTHALTCTHTTHSLCTQTHTHAHSTQHVHTYTHTHTHAHTTQSVHTACTHMHTHREWAIH